ncbi:MAG: phospholipid/cholesterol/gamma-HCH transport system substrate-binding protein, partial [Solirubrobacteraceae bacterium]|nr:phospholipid/cholesterol/gamma-HCH transport system substrate-binding protein [Solirubrobacteraceae bacterium]
MPWAQSYGPSYSRAMNDGEATSRHAEPGRNADAAFERGNASISQGDLESAEQAYAEADQDGHAAAAANLGLLLERRGQRTAAEAAYQRADERGSGLGAFRLGLLMSGREDWDGANAAWARADERGHEQAGPDVQALLRPGGGRSSEVPSGSSSSSAFANPVMVGAVTVLAALVAVFLAYNANAGLPFVPTKELKAEFVDGSNLVIGNDVREGGFRVGLVSDMRPIELPNGQVGAQLTLKLDKANGNVPVDSTATIRPRSVLGLKFVEIAKGTSTKMIPDGGTLKISRTTVPVQFDDIFKTFDAKTRASIQQDLVGFGDTLAGRGSALNDTIHSLPELLAHLQPVARYLSDPGTQLTRFFTSLNAFMSTIAPVA